MDIRFLCLIFFAFKKCTYAKVISNTTQNVTSFSTTTENLLTVIIRPQPSVKYINVPTSKEPVVTWFDVHKGIFPDTSEIEENDALFIGEPITLMIYLKDESKSYDIRVNDCWAYDKQNFENSDNKLHLNKANLATKTALLEKWQKYTFPKGETLSAVLYAELKAFKFPDSTQMYFSCDIELCFKSCDNRRENTTVSRKSRK